VQFGKPLVSCFHSWCHPLEAYTRALEEAGLLIDCLREPAQRPVVVAGDIVEARWRRLPLFLFLRAVKPRQTGITRSEGKTSGSFAG